MTQKPLERITVAEIMDTCGMRRQHFYYYFTDIYDLLRWTFEKEALELCSSNRACPPGRTAFCICSNISNQNRAVCHSALDSLGKGIFEDGCWRLMSAASWMGRPAGGEWRK